MSDDLKAYMLEHISYGREDERVGERLANIEADLANRRKDFTKLHDSVNAELLEEYNEFSNSEYKRLNKLADHCLDELERKQKLYAQLNKLAVPKELKVAKKEMLGRLNNDCKRLLSDVSSAKASAAKPLTFEQFQSRKYDDLIRSIGALQKRVTDLTQSRTLHQEKVDAIEELFKPVVISIEDASPEEVVELLEEGEDQSSFTDEQIYEADAYLDAQKDAAMGL